MVTKTKHLRTKYEYYDSAKKGIEELNRPKPKTETVVHYLSIQQEREDKLRTLKKV